jgi:hypothetical protein
LGPVDVMRRGLFGFDARRWNAWDIVIVIMALAVFAQAIGGAVR